MDMLLFWGACILLPINVYSLIGAIRKDDVFMMVLSTVAIGCSIGMIVIGLQA